MKVVKLEQPNLRDVPASLRRLAQQMEDGTVNAATHAIVVAVDANGEIEVYGYGDIGNRAHEVGVLQMAAMSLAGKVE